MRPAEACTGHGSDPAQRESLSQAAGAGHSLSGAGSGESREGSSAVQTHSSSEEAWVVDGTCRWGRCPQPGTHFDSGGGCSLCRGFIPRVHVLQRGSGVCVDDDHGHLGVVAPASRSHLLSFPIKGMDDKNATKLNELIQVG